MARRRRWRPCTVRYSRDETVARGRKPAAAVAEEAVTGEEERTPTSGWPSGAHARRLRSSWRHRRAAEAAAAVEEEEAQALQAPHAARWGRASPAACPLACAVRAAGAAAAAAAAQRPSARRQRAR